MTNSRIRRKIGTWRSYNNCWNRRRILPRTRSAKWLPRVKVPVHAEEVFALVALEFYSTLGNRRRVWMWHTIRMNLASRQKFLWMTMFCIREPYLVCFIHKLYRFIKLSFHSKTYVCKCFQGRILGQYVYQCHDFNLSKHASVFITFISKVGIFIRAWTWRGNLEIPRYLR